MSCQWLPNKGNVRKRVLPLPDRELGYVLFFDIINNGAVDTLVMIFVYLPEVSTGWRPVSGGYVHLPPGSCWLSFMRFCWYKSSHCDENICLFIPLSIVEISILILSMISEKWNCFNVHFPDYLWGCMSFMNCRLYSTSVYFIAALYILMLIL